MCCSPWGHKELEKTAQWNRTECPMRILFYFIFLLKTNFSFSHFQITENLLCSFKGFPGGSAVKNSLSMQEVWIQFLA